MNRKSGSRSSGSSIPSRSPEDRGCGEVYHGGNLSAARLRFANAPQPWLDLSTGINPIPYPVGELPPQAWTRLPDAASIRSLESAAALAYRARDPAMVVASPGEQALIQLLPRLLPARRVGILGFTYAEHEACWRASGAEVEIVEEIAALGAFDVAVIVNPNNPDGRLAGLDELSELAASLARKGGQLVVDEAFMDAEERAFSLVPALPTSGALVLRSFGKLYGLAGLRLGFAVAPFALASTIRRALGPWAVSGAAVEIGGRAFADEMWRRAAATRLAADAARLDAMLLGAGFTVIGGTTLFRLVRHAQASEWFERFGRAGILVRPFPARPKWLRFGLPGTEADWQRLEAALRLGS
jgi:cobalamin biosynthetic protein CobC